MKRIIFIAGTFDENGGKKSILMDTLFRSILNNLKKNFNNIDFLNYYYKNGGNLTDIKNCLEFVPNSDIVFWFANVSNDVEKMRNIKELNPRCIFINSKRNDDNKYTFGELISRSLEQKANLTIQFSKLTDKLFNMSLFDPLGNCYYNGLNVQDLSEKLITRITELCTFTRKPSNNRFENWVKEIPNEKEFFEFAKYCSEIFHNLVNPDKDCKRFLGNLSFRCQNGFPSFKDQNGIVYVSRRNVNKGEIKRENFVPCFLDENNEVQYYGNYKPSVDTPIQLLLYQLFPDMNYMIHAHCYFDKNYLGNLTNDQFVEYIEIDKPIPCGALEEVDAIKEKVKLSEKLNSGKVNFIVINLIGHGCILMTKDIERFTILKNDKKRSFISRPSPERQNIKLNPDLVVDVFFKKD